MIDSVLNIFYQISSIPRCSKHEDKIVKFVQDWAISNQFCYKTDSFGNTLVFSEVTDVNIILQSHLDMVCEKRAGLEHNFLSEPISIINDGKYIYADGTSLGADNGIGMAISMFVKNYFKGVRDDIALLFTVDEETGLNGSKNLDGLLLKGKYLINIDSEEDDTIVVGCAGGTDMIITGNLIKKDIFQNYPLEITISGFSGGHSGIDIDKGFGNALKVMIKLLCYLEIYDIVDISGGTAHNAIPRTAKAKVLTDRTKDEIIKHFYAISEAFINDKPYIEIFQASDCEIVYDMKDILPILNRLHHGVFTKLTGKFSGVESSSNFAKVEVLKDVNKIKIVESLRSSSTSAMELLKSEIIRHLDMFDYYFCCEYPGWQPDEGSELLAKSQLIYKDLFGKTPHVKAIHAGLECGIFKMKNKDLDIISIGPNVYFPHCPEERLEIDSVGRITNFLLELIKSLRV